MAVAIASLALRIAIVVGSEHALGSNVHAGFDESVYVGASWLLRHGHLPYRDFVYVFPPGFLALLWPLTSITALFGGPAATVTAGRFAAAVAGSWNIWLVGRLGQRWLGWPAGLFAAAIFATTPAVIASDTLVLQEPFVNLAILLAFTAWSSTRSSRRNRLYRAALLLGIAISIKLVAALFIIPLLLIGPFAQPWWDRVRFAVTAAAPLALMGGLLGVFVGWRAPFEQAVLAQVTRPSDGNGSTRINSLLPLLRGQIWLTRPLSWLPLATAAIVFIILCALACASGSRAGRLWGSTGLIVGGFLMISPSYFGHYAALLAPAAAVIIAWALTRLPGRVARTGPRLAAVALLAVGVAIAVSQTLTALDIVRKDSGAMNASLVRALKNADCLTAVRPQPLIEVNRIPSADRRGHVLLDVYGTALVAARHERSPNDGFSASESATTQRVILRQARDCSHILITDRSCPKGAKDLTTGTAAKLRRRGAVVARSGCMLLLRNSNRTRPSP